jgi:hypothetical protein
MKWYYRLKLRKMLTEIESLKRATESSLRTNYTDCARLRILNVLVVQLEKRLMN